MDDTEIAFKWIARVLHNHKVPFMVSGGLAARMHGSRRELADIDIEIPKKCFPLLLAHLKPYVTYGPARYRDENWDTYLLTLQYGKQFIDISSVDDVLLYDAAHAAWINPAFDLQKATVMQVYGCPVPVTSKDELIRYKRLSRDLSI